MEIIEKIVKILIQSENILIVLHENPDGDTIATSLALRLALLKRNIQVACACKDAVPQPFIFLPGSDVITDDFLIGDYDAIIVLDCGDLRRSGFPERLQKFAKLKKRLINIDHHPNNDLRKVANYNLIDESAASVSEIVYDLINSLKIPIDKNIATCLLTALYTDTGGFKHATTTTRSLECAAAWMDKGAKMQIITKNILLNRSVHTLKLWGIALSRVHKNSLGLVTSVVTRQDMEENGAVDSDLGGIVNLINSIPGTKAAILLSETADGRLKASLRTEDDKIDISRLASLFNGGGHRRAAGFTIPGHLEKDDHGHWFYME